MILTVASAVLILSTAGCSSKGKADYIKSDGANIYINNKLTYLTEYNGITGTYNIEDDPVVVVYKYCTEHIRDCPENRQGVHEGDLSSYKKAEYFDAYINTFSVMHVPTDEPKSKEVTISTQNKDLKPLDNIRPEAYNTLQLLDFEPIKVATFGDVVEIRGNNNNLIVRDTNITIPGILSVTKGTKEVTQQVEIGEIAVMKYESNNFNFYQYGDNLIKISKDYNVEDYITLKALK